jgi:hypothetical protein
MPRRPPGRPRGDLRWSTFLKSHATAIVACDFSKDLLYSFDETRRLADAQVGKLGDAVLYVKPGVAWSAFNAASTHQRAATRRESDSPPESGRPSQEPGIRAVRTDEDPQVILDTLRAVETLRIEVTDANRDWRALLDALMPT